MDLKKDRIEYVNPNTMMTAITWKNESGEVMLTDTCEGLFPGRYLFLLKDSLGLPLDFAIDRIRSKGLYIEWVSFIESARGAGWYDFQIHEALTNIRQELPEHREWLDGVISHFKVYVMKYPLQYKSDGVTPTRSKTS